MNKSRLSVVSELIERMDNAEDPVIVAGDIRAVLARERLSYKKYSRLEDIRAMEQSTACQDLLKESLGYADEGDKDNAVTALYLVLQWDHPDKASTAKPVAGAPDKSTAKTNTSGKAPVKRVQVPKEAPVRMMLDVNDPDFERKRKASAALMRKKNLSAGWSADDYDAYVASGQGVNN